MTAPARTPDPRYARAEHKRGAGIKIFQTENMIAHMPPRTLSRCTCGVLVMCTDEGEEGHMDSSHPQGVRLDHFPESAQS